MAHQMTRILLEASLAQLPVIEATEATAATLCADYHELVRKAQGIVAAQPYLMDCGVREPNTFFHLQIDARADVAVLTWTSPRAVGGADRCRFPARLLDMDWESLSSWQLAQQNAALVASTQRQPVGCSK
jgi:hypothetical protein